MHGRDENWIKILVETPRWKRSLGPLRHRCKDNIKMDIREKKVVWVQTEFISNVVNRPISFYSSHE
jgi:hypothetical protein